MAEAGGAVETMRVDEALAAATGSRAVADAAALDEFDWFCLACFASGDWMPGDNGCAPRSAVDALLIAL